MKKGKHIGLGEKGKHIGLGEKGKHIGLPVRRHFIARDEDDDGKGIFYEVDGAKYQMMNVVYEPGKILEP